MVVCSSEEGYTVGEASASHYGKPSAGLRRGQGRAEGGGRELILVAEVSLHEVDAAPEAAELEASLLLVVPVAG